MQGFAVLCVTTPPRGLSDRGLYAKLFQETTAAGENSGSIELYAIEMGKFMKSCVYPKQTFAKLSQGTYIGL